jgi:hypothetical protein
MSLLALPIELTQRIIRFTIPESFQNVAATCKLLYVASRFLVDEYKKACRLQHFQYSRHRIEYDWECEAISLPGGVHMTCNNPQHWDQATAVSGIKIVNAVDLLLILAREPHLASYIESLDLKHPDRHIREAEEPPYFSEDPDDLQKLFHLYSTAIPSTPETDGEDFTLFMKRMTPFLADAFILNLVPNVVEIALSKSWGRADIVNTANLELLDAMVSRANDSSIRDAPLAKLAVVKPYIGHGWSSRACLTPLASFLALNSVREFYMGGVQAFSDDDTDIPYNPRHDVYGNSLRKIELNGSAVGPRALSALLSRTPQLECLHLGLESKPDGFGYQYNIGHLLAIISEHVGGTLTELAMCTNPLNLDTYTLTNMHGFTQLRVLELEAEFLYGQAYSSPELLPSGHFDEYFPAFPTPLGAELPRLVDLLPPSLELFKLKFHYVAQRSLPQRDDADCIFFRLPELLTGFRDERHIKLPRLHDVVFDPPSDLERYSDPNTDDEVGESVQSVLREVHDCGIRWEHGALSCFGAFNYRFDVKDAAEDS